MAASTPTPTKRRQPGRKQLDEKCRQGVIRGRALGEQSVTHQRPGQQPTQGQHGQGEDEDGREGKKAVLVRAVFQGPELVAQVGQYAQRNERDHQRDDRPPGVVERGFGIEDTD